jgi:hypothetical protein
MGAARLGLLRCAVLLALTLPRASAVAPEGPSQQCADDAGPPWVDDVEHFGVHGDYFDASPASVVGDGDDCPAPLATACAAKGKRAAFLAGPIDCDEKGWFCRIARQDGFVPSDGFRDSNYAHCNRTDADESDADGHCHGSDSDSTYGWWVRDHWFRGYAGLLTCCCDWRSLKGLTNRCDYRRPVAIGEDLETCRDANEDHGMSYEGTCAAYADVAFDDPALRHDGASCWSVSKFADPEAAGIEEERTTKDDSRAATSAAPRSRPRAFGGPATFFFILMDALLNLSRLWWQPLL